VYILTQGSSCGVDHIHANSRKSSPMSMRVYEVIVITFVYCNSKQFITDGLGSWLRKFISLE
jgi:hypothetical protein